jgi:hypothetical protein
VVAGIPGRVIQMRFPEKLASQLLESRWWEYSPRVPCAFDFEKPEHFIEQLAQEQPERYTPDVLSWEILEAELQSADD